MSGPSTAVTDILRALNSLTADELNQVASKIALLKANPFGVAKPARNGVSVVTNSHDELLVLAICEFFEGQGLDNCHPAMLRRAHGYDAFRQKVEPIVVFLTRGAGSPLNRTELMAFFRLGISLLYSNMQSMGIAVSPRTMMNQIHRVPSTFNSAFPGYSKLGILRLVIKR